MRFSGTRGPKEVGAARGTDCRSGLVPVPLRGPMPKLGGTRAQSGPPSVGRGGTREPSAVAWLPMGTTACGGERYTHGAAAVNLHPVGGQITADVPPNEAGRQLGWGPPARECARRGAAIAPVQSVTGREAGRRRIQAASRRSSRRSSSVVTERGEAPSWPAGAGAGPVISARGGQGAGFRSAPLRRHKTGAAEASTPGGARRAAAGRAGPQGSRVAACTLLSEGSQGAVTSAVHGAELQPVPAAAHVAFELREAVVDTAGRAEEGIVVWDEGSACVSAGLSPTRDLPRVICHRGARHEGRPSGDVVRVEVRVAINGSFVSSMSDRASIRRGCTGGDGGAARRSVQVSVGLGAQFTPRTLRSEGT